MEEFEKARALSAGSPLIIGDLGYCYALWGRKDKAQELLGELLDLSERRYVSPVNIAVIHFGLGSKAEGFRWLERAYEERDCRLVWLKEYPPTSACGGIRASFPWFESSAWSAEHFHPLAYRH